MVIVFILLMTICSSAAEDFNSDELSYTGFRWTVVDGKVQESDITSSVTVTHNSVLGVPTINYTIPNGSSDTKTQGLIAFKTQSLKSKHEYNLKFGFAMGHPSVCSFLASLVFYDSNNNVIRQQDIVVVNEGIKSNEINYIDVNFIPNVDGLSSGFRTELQFCFLSGTVYANTFRLTQEISLTDTDDNSGFVDGIWGTIKHIFIAIVGGECQDGDYSSPGLFGKLRDGFDSLGNRIGTFFDNLKISIEAKIDSIQQWFIDLGENIVEGLKGLFIPEEGYFESKMEELKSFFADHFGIVYTAADISLEVIRKLTSLTPPESAVLHVPAWQMQMPWDNNKVLTLVPESDVNFTQYINSSGVLHTFYSFYRGFISVVLIFLLIRYAMMKFDYVFGKDGEGTD